MTTAEGHCDDLGGLFGRERHSRWSNQQDGLCACTSVSNLLRYVFRTVEASTRRHPSMAASIPVTLEIHSQDPLGAHDGLSFLDPPRSTRSLRHPLIIMRSTRLFFAAIVAVLFLGVADAVECELVSTSEILKKIDQTASVAKCGIASGYNLNPPPGKPTLAQLDSLCAQEACRSAVSSIAALKLPSCTISMLNGINLREIVATIDSHCSKKRPTTTKTSSDDTAIPAAAIPGSASSTPSAAKKATTPAATKTPATGMTPYPSNAQGSTSPGPTSATTGALVAAEGAPKPNLRKNCH